MKTVLLFIVVCCLSCEVVQGYCAWSRIKVTVSEFGTPHYECEWDGQRYRIGSKIKFVKDCLTCTCTKRGMGCCAGGKSAGVFGTPPHCEVIEDDCKAYVVLKADRTRLCSTRLPWKEKSIFKNL